MALQQPLAMQPVSGDASLLNTAIQFRNMVTTMVAVANSFAGSEGIPNIGIPASGAAAGDFAVTQRGAGANASVDVAGGHALINGDDVTGQGCYQAWNDGTVNVAVPLSPPAQRNHRLVLQVQDKLSNGAWSGYQAQLTLLQDTGGGTPAQPNSAITLAIITVNPADPSVQNAAIQDYRRACGPVSAATAANESRTSTTTLADSASLQLWGLRHNSWYGFAAFLNFDGVNQTTGSDPGGISVSWRVPSTNVHLYYAAFRQDSSNTPNTSASQVETDTWNGWTSGAGTSKAAVLLGGIHPTATTPNNYAVLQFAQNHSSGTPTRLLTGSMIYAWPVS